MIATAATANETNVKLVRRLDWWETIMSKATNFSRLSTSSSVSVDGRPLKYHSVVAARSRLLVGVASQIFSQDKQCIFQGEKCIQYAYFVCLHSMPTYMFLLLRFPLSVPCQHPSDLESWRNFEMPRCLRCFSLLPKAWQVVGRNGVIELGLARLRWHYLQALNGRRKRNASSKDLQKAPCAVFFNNVGLRQFCCGAPLSWIFSGTNGSSEWSQFLRASPYPSAKSKSP